MWRCQRKCCSEVNVFCGGTNVSIVESATASVVVRVPASRGYLGGASESVVEMSSDSVAVC